MVLRVERGTIAAHQISITKTDDERTHVQDSMTDLYATACGPGMVETLALRLSADHPQERTGRIEGVFSVVQGYDARSQAVERVSRGMWKQV